jgi:hypothetical protein
LISIEQDALVVLRALAFGGGTVRKGECARRSESSLAALSLAVAQSGLQAGGLLRATGLSRVGELALGVATVLVGSLGKGRVALLSSIQHPVSAEWSLALGRNATSSATWSSMGGWSGS